MAFQPMPLSRRPLPFDHPEWIFELKYDGFRALAVIQNGRTQLISRNGHPFSFDLRIPLHVGKTVLDGEIVCVDEQGKPQFRDLLFHRGEPCFFAFDLLMTDGKDVRSEKLTDRKQELRRFWFVLDGVRLYIGANVNRQWVRNLQKTPQVKLSIAGENIEGIARFLSDHAEHEHAMTAIRRKYWMFRPIIELGRFVAAIGLMHDKTGSFEVLLAG